MELLNDWCLDTLILYFLLFLTNSWYLGITLIISYLARSCWPVYVACFEIVGGPRHITKSDMKMVRLEVICGDVARHLLINFHLFRWLCLHTSAPLAFCYALKWVVWKGLLLIAAGMCFGFIFLANQEMLYWQPNQKRWQLWVVVRL